MLQSVEEVGMEKGMEIGRIQTLEEVAKNLLQTGKLTQKEIAMVTAMKPWQISKLAKELKSG